MTHNGWFVSRLYVCVLVMALPLLPAGDSQSGLSRSSVHASLSSDGDEASAHGNAELPQIRRVLPNFGQSGPVRLADTRSDAKRQRFTPWGGKRTLDDNAMWKRMKFQPWGGKRFVRRAVVPRYANSRISSYTDDSKREFHPWGGKRRI